MHNKVWSRFLALVFAKVHVHVKGFDEALGGFKAACVLICCLPLTQKPILLSFIVVGQDITFLRSEAVCNMHTTLMHNRTVYSQYPKMKVDM